MDDTVTFMDKRMSYISLDNRNIFSRKSVTALLVVGSLFLVSACSDSSSGDGSADGSPITPMMPVINPNEVVPEPMGESIADRIFGDVEYGTLLNLIEDADLAEALQNDNGGVGWTLFAPSDRAFSNDAFEGLSRAEMVTVLGNHLFSGRLPFSELSPGPLVMTEGVVEVVQSPDGDTTIGGARVVARDRNFNNGTIHFVDVVLQAQ